MKPSPILSLRNALRDPFFTRNPLSWVAILSGVLGFAYGWLFAAPQDSVVSSQIIAGVVDYPQHTLFSISFISIWNLFNQTGAVLLKLGVSEFLCSYLISGITAMVSFLALALVAYAFGQSVILAVATPLFILVSRAYQHGVNYPIYFVQSPTWFIAGLAFTLLAIALLANQRYRPGAFLIGLAPAIHVVGAFALWGVVAMVVCLNWRRLRENIAPASKYFGIGFLFTCVSLAHHLLHLPRFPDISKELADFYLFSIARIWDNHRLVVEFNSTGLVINMMVPVLGWIVCSKHSNLSHSQRITLQLFAGFSLFGLFFSFLTHFPPDKIPSLITIATPQKLSNVNVFCFFALLLGLVGGLAASLWVQISRVLITLLMICVCLGVFSLHTPYPLFLAAFGMMVLIVGFQSARKPASSLNHLNFLVNLLFGIFILTAVVIHYTPGFKTFMNRYPDRTNNVFFNQVSQKKETVMIPIQSRGLSSLMGHIQLVARRPLLFNPLQLDAIPYALGLAPLVQTTILDIYGFDFTKMPPGWDYFSGLDPLTEHNKQLWENRSLAEWQVLRDKYGASGVLTRSDWFLALPVEADDDNFTLFWIPGQDELGNPGVEQGLLRASALKLIYNAKEHFKNGDLNSAIHGFAGALEKDNDFPYIHYVLGSLFAHQNEFSRAEKHLEQAIALEPNLVRARRALVEVYAHQGKQPQAKFHEAYLKKHPVGKPGSQ